MKKQRKKKLKEKKNTEQIYKDNGTPTNCSICINRNNKKEQRKGQKKYLK